MGLGRELRIQGRNLNTATDTTPSLFTAIVRHRIG